MTPEYLRGQQSVLQTHRILLHAGISLVSSFIWVFVFEFAYVFSGSVVSAFFVAVSVYALSQIVLILATPLSASHLRHGVKRSMIFGSLLAALALAVLGASLAGYFSSPLSWGSVFFGLLLGLYRALYWIPYRLQSARAARNSNVFFEIMFALLPAFAGVTLATVYLSPLRLLFGAALLVVLSVIPIFFLEEVREPFRWRYLETFTKLFESRYQALALRSAFSGIETTTLFILWPLTVFLIVGSSYLLFGIVMSVSLLMLLIFRGLYRGLLRRMDIHTSIPVEVAFSVSGWILRLAAGSPLMIVFADSYSYVSAPAGSPEVVFREQRADGGSYIDEYTALQEIGMGFGRVVMCLFVCLLLFVMPLSVVLALSLIIAAASAGAASALSHKIRLQAY